jgi:Domain of unknown function (DUF1735)
MMKKISILSICIVALLTGCLKDSPNVDFSQIKPTVMMINSGLGYFSSAALNFTSDTITVPIQVNLASVDRMSKDITVQLAIDDQALSDYNATSGIQYEKMADSSFSFPTTSGTIAAGQRLLIINVTFYKHTFDPSKSYMLPISITSADGVDLSSNFNTMYFHVIGNPIAGSYSELWTRWNASDTTGEPAYDHVDVGPVVFSPVDATTISVVSEGTGETNIISFTNDNGTLSNFAVAFDPAQFDPANSAYLGVTLTSGPFLLYADPVLNIYHVYWTYNNSAGSARCILNEYQKL